MIGGFNHDQHNKLPHKVVVCDESCLPGRQTVQLADGSFRMIQDIVNKEQRVDVMSVNPITMEIEAKPVTGLIRSKTFEPLVEINSSRGDSKRSARLLRCTANHRIALPNMDFVRAANLSEGQEILVRGKFLTPYQKSFAIGTLLGDSSMTRTHKGILQMVHGDSQIDYLNYKKKIFFGLTGSEHRSDRDTYPGQFGSSNYVSTCVIDDLHDIYDELYPNGRKSINTSFLNRYFDEISLAALFCDDGSCSDKMNDACIHTYSFTYNECLKLARVMREKFGLESKPIMVKDKYWKLTFDADSSRELLHVIAKHTPECMGKKNPLASAMEPNEKFLDVGPAKVKDFCRYPTIEKRGHYVYDLEVADNHNYIAGNTVVHNSMIDLFLFNSLLKALDSNTKLILSGDPYQLPPVGPGAPFRDLINSSVVPCYELMEIHRQAADSRIISTAHSVLDGDYESVYWDGERKDFQIIQIEDEEKIAAYIEEEILCAKHRYGVLPSDVQVLTPMHKGSVGTKALNERFQACFNPPSPAKLEYISGFQKFREGDRVIQMKNDYELGVFNGDLGFIDTIYKGHEVKANGLLRIRFDDTSEYVNLQNSDQVNRIALAYALTVHKSQGSEYPLVLIPCHSTHTWMWRRPLLYTAITRAQNYCVLVGDTSVMVKAIKDNQEDARMTHLKERIRP